MWSARMADGWKWRMNSCLIRRSCHFGGRTTSKRGTWNKSPPNHLIRFNNPGNVSLFFPIFFGRCSFPLFIPKVDFKWVGARARRKSCEHLLVFLKIQRDFMQRLSLYSAVECFSSSSSLLRHSSFFLLPRTQFQCMQRVLKTWLRFASDNQILFLRAHTQFSIACAFS